MPDPLSGLSEATKEALELVQSLRGLNAQAQPLIKLINAIRSILFWENVPLSIGLCIIWVFVCLYPNLFVVFGPHCIIIVTLGMIFNQKIRKENRSQAELEADLNAEHLARERAAQEQEERFRQKGKELLFDSGPVSAFEAAFDLGSSVTYFMAKTAASFLSVELPTAPDLAEVAKTLDGVQSVVDNLSNQLAVFNAVLYSLSWQDQKQTYGILKKVLVSWFMWATLLYFVPFRYVALFVGEITLISLSRPGQLLLQTVFSLFDARTGGQEFASSIGSSQTAVKKDE